MPRIVPLPTTLREAVVQVINQNASIGYRPSRFIQVTQGGYAEKLAEACDALIRKGETFETLQTQIQRDPTTLTLEDLIVHSPYSRNWDLEIFTVDTAVARVEAWDKLVGKSRWTL